jgi:cytochrome c2
MRNNRLLIIALILIALGLIGNITTTWLSRYREPRQMFQMPGMMMDGMMGGGGMMNREQMREMMQRMMPVALPPRIKPTDLPDSDSKGAQLLTRYCSQCHYLPAPGMHTKEEWLPVTNRMFARMSMMSGMMNIESPSPEEQQIIVAYLKTHALKSVSPNTLPSPESRGAVLFKEICSQCHSLPDPKLHTSEEWPGVVERMQNNIRTMNKKVLTDQEKKAIIAYLSDHARK